MKLRVRGNSIRLRLTQREVAELATKGRVEESVAFAPGERLAYALVCGDAPALRARCVQGSIEVSIPSSLAKDWAAGEQLGLEAEQPIGPGETLRILVEKDLACIRPRTGEDDTDAYPNPKDHCS